MLGNDWGMQHLFSQHIFTNYIHLYLFKVRQLKVDITISKVLNYKQGVVWGWWKNVNSSNNTLNETEFKIPFIGCLQFNVTCDLVSGFPGEGFDNCQPKCCIINTDRK